MCAVSEMSHDFKHMMVSQNYVDILRSEPGSCTETCLKSVDDVNQVISIRVKEVIDTEEEEDPLLISPFVKTKHEANCMSTCIQC